MLLSRVCRLGFAMGNRPRILTNPKDVSKLIFEEDGRCCLYRHTGGERELKWLTRAGTFFTVLNTLLSATEATSPICAGTGYMFLAALQALSSRTVRSLYLHSNLETVDIEFFNAYWKNKTISFHITQFQEPRPSMAGFLRVEITSIGKVWIKLERNEFRNVNDYEETLDSILLGKPITNVTIPKKKHEP